MQKIKYTTVLHKRKNFFSDNTVVYFMPQTRSVDIDSHIDFKVAELLIDKSIFNLYLWAESYNSLKSEIVMDPC